MADLEWKLLDEERRYDGYRKVDRRTFEFPDGSQADFDVIASSDAVAVFALTSLNTVVCYKTFRPGPMIVLHELPGGGVDEGSSPEEAARKELLEETGYEGSFEYLGSYSRDAYSSGRWHMFVATDCEKVADQELEFEEWGEVVELSIDEFKEQLFAGNMTDTTLGYAALHHLDLL